MRLYLTIIWYCMRAIVICMCVCVCPCPCIWARPCICVLFCCVWLLLLLLYTHPPLFFACHILQQRRKISAAVVAVRRTNTLRTDLPINECPETQNATTTTTETIGKSHSCKTQTLTQMQCKMENCILTNNKTKQATTIVLSIRQYVGWAWDFIVMLQTHFVYKQPLHWQTKKAQWLMWKLLSSLSLLLL